MRLDWHHGGTVPAGGAELEGWLALWPRTPWTVAGKTHAPDTLLGIRLADFLARHEGIALTVESRDRSFDFDEEPIDLAIHYGKPVWPGAVAEFLCTEVVVPVAAPRLAARHPDMAGAALLHVTARPRLWAQWFAEHGGEEVWRGQRFDQFSLAISAAVAGLGVALLPTYLIEQELASGDLVVMREAPMQTENAYYIVTPEGRQGHAAAQAFRAWLLGQVSPQSRAQA